MLSKIRKTPIVCSWISMVQLFIGKLKLSKKYLNKTIEMEDGKKFIIFRHITTYPLNQVDRGCVFIVGFKFARLSLKTNKLTSIIPMLMIAGFPGFTAKMYAVNLDDGHWQGMYQWKSVEHLEDYKKSFVFKMMNKRALPDSITTLELPNSKLTDFIDNHNIEKQTNRLLRKEN